MMLVAAGVGGRRRFVTLGLEQLMGTSAGSGFVCGKDECELKSRTRRRKT